MEIYEGRTHVGELMWENGEIWRNMEIFGGIWREGIHGVVLMCGSVIATPPYIRSTGTVSVN